MEIVSLDFIEPRVLQIVPVLSSDIVVRVTLRKQAREKVLNCVYTS